MNFHIRLSVESDIEAAYELIYQLGYQGVDKKRFSETYRDILLRGDFRILVAESATGGIVGLEVISIRPQVRLAGTLVSIDELVVSEERRGSGVGAALLDESKKIARAIALKEGQPVRLQLETRRSRESYRREFYVKNGFQEVDSALMRFEVAVETD